MFWRNTTSAWLCCDWSVIGVLLTAGGGVSVWGSRAAAYGEWPSVAVATAPTTFPLSNAYLIGLLVESRAGGTDDNVVTCGMRCSRR